MVIKTIPVHSKNRLVWYSDVDCILQPKNTRKKIILHPTPKNGINHSNVSRIKFVYQVALFCLLLSVPVVVNDASQDESSPGSMGGHHTFILKYTREIIIAQFTLNAQHSCTHPQLLKKEQVVLFNKLYTQKARLIWYMYSHVPLFCNTPWNFYVTQPSEKAEFQCR
jgi:hypothetical protein